MKLPICKSELLKKENLKPILTAVGSAAALVLAAYVVDRVVNAIQNRKR